ncbi:hypothetical protein LIER_32862 [Lithospermum erythrorhizon]|uniref:Uncharacterized protein n=1 Tax=Lithospermum erythrorhizon TaxID=34254 RepID=A0AAV3RVZ7_LITER
MLSLPFLMKQMCGFEGVQQMASSHKRVLERSSSKKGEASLDKVAMKWERNSRVFGGGQVCANVVYHRVVASVHGRASSWRHIKRSKKNSKLCLEWGLEHNMLS